MVILELQAAALSAMFKLLIIMNKIMNRKCPIIPGLCSFSFLYLLCSKLCWHNRRTPRYGTKMTMAVTFHTAYLSDGVIGLNDC